MSPYRSNQNPQFRTKFSEDIFNHKYAHEGAATWDEMAAALTKKVVEPFVPAAVAKATYELIRDMKFIPGGRYLYYAARERRYYNNCFLLRAEEDTREDWAELSWKAERCLMIGGGIGVDYSVYRPSGTPLKSTGGRASGPLPKMLMLNEIGRHVMQGGSRRSALYASLNWKHADAPEFLTMKNWYDIHVADTGYTIGKFKELDFNFPAPLDMTNISLNYDDDWLYTENREKDPTFLANVRQAMMTGEPGFSFNFGPHGRETLRNACTEVSSEDDSDVCNLGSLNMALFDNESEWRDAVMLATVFLLCGTLVGELPYEKVAQVRAKNRRLGLGIMGVHEWLLKRGKKYGPDDELARWLEAYAAYSEMAGKVQADALNISRPVAYRAIAPTGSIGILAGTTTGIEPLYAVAYKRRYLKGKDQWVHQYVVDGAAQSIIKTGVNPGDIESSLDLAGDIERRVQFQAFVQRYVDMGISSTLNLPAWGSAANNESTVEHMASVISTWAPMLRGLTVYPDGARGGQPLTQVSYEEAVSRGSGEYVEETHDVCVIGGKSGVCGS